MSKTKFLSVLSSFADKLSERIDSIFARKSDLTAHTGDTDVHITADERTTLNDVSSKSHEHSNKVILDNTTASFTSEEQAKLSGISTGAEVNIIEMVKINGTALTPDSSKAVDILTDSIYEIATSDDVDSVISGNYVSTGYDPGDAFEDIDAIIAGTYS